MKASVYRNRVNRSMHNQGEISLKELTELMGSLSDEIHINRYNIMTKDETVLSCVDLIASTIASMPIQLYKSTDEGKEKVDNELSYLLKHRPNPTMNALPLIREWIANMLLNQDSFIHISTRRGFVTELALLDPKVTTLERIYEQNEYLIKTTLYDQSKTYAYREVLHLRDIADRFETVKAISEAKKYCEKLVHGYFKSDGATTLKGVITTQEDLDEEALEYLTHSFIKTLKNHGYAALDHGMEFKSITQSSNFKEMLVNELKEDLDNAIYKTYRVPKSLILGDGKESSYASMNVIQQQFIKSLTPIILQIEQELNYKLLTTKEIQEGYYFKLNTKNALRMTDSERIDYYVKAIQSGVLSVNECRELEECNYREGADSLLMSLNYVPLDKWENYLESKNNAEKSGTALALTKNHLKGGEENESDEVL